jgi:glucose/arabinose dehydrogenase
MTRHLHRLFLLLVAVGAILPKANGQLTRQANTTLTFPPDLPSATGYTLTNALGSLTFASPIDVASPPGVTNRLFVVERNNGIQIVNLDTMTKSTFLNLTGLLAALPSPTPTLDTGGECGLLSVAFHPNYNQNGYYYIFHSLTVNSERHERVVRLKASGTPGNYNAATTTDNSSYTPMITQRDEASNHNGGDLAFGPDGYLYVSFGDEGNQHDFFDNARRIAKDFFGGILRLDVDLKPENLAPNAHVQSNSTTYPSAIHAGTYKVPADNPWVNLPADGSGNSTYNGFTFPKSSVRTELWAIGHRNPWRMNFDPPTGRLFVGDVGQDNWEEVDIVTSGFNGGWSWREGLHPHTPQQPPTAEPPGFAPNPPIYEYSHGTGNFQGNSVTGGIVYRGTPLPELFGAYVFCDYVSGNIWAIRPSTPLWTAQRLGADTDIVAIGTDPRNGDALFCDFNGGTGMVKRLVRGSTTGTPPPATLSAAGIFSNLTNLTPNQGIVPYEPNVSFWTDYAVKSRWFSIKNLTDTVGFSADGNWTLPTGMVWIKHFDIDLERGNPATRRRIETRVLVKTATDIYGLTYQWNNIGSGTQTDATLVPEAGLTFPIPGSNPPQTWRYPSQSECKVCHTSVGGFALSFNTRQMNRNHDYGLQTQNQIGALSTAGYFSAPVSNVANLPALARADDPNSSIEWKVRSYFAANCAQCHQPNGAALGFWDARPTTPTDAAGLINGALVNNGGNSANRFIVPGSIANSMALSRLQGISVPRMPPLDTSLRDLVSEQLLTDWINQLVTRQSFTQWQIANFGSTSAPEAQPTADPDLDGDTNSLEFLRGTTPTQENPPFLSTLSATTSGGNFILNFQQPAHRSVLVETTTNFQSWSLWNVSGNAPSYPPTTIPRTLMGPIDTPNRFFRLKLGQP